MQTKRLLILISILPIMVLLLPASGTKGPTPVTIIYYRCGYVEGEEDADSKNTRAFIEEFQKRYPYITVQILRIQYIPQRTKQLYAALDARENFNTFSAAPSQLPDLVSRGIISMSSRS